MFIPAHDHYLSTAGPIGRIIHAHIPMNFSSLGPSSVQDRPHQNRAPGYGMGQ